VRILLEGEEDPDADTATDVAAGSSRVAVVHDIGMFVRCYGFVLLCIIVKTLLVKKNLLDGYRSTSFYPNPFIQFIILLIPLLT
jgi:hypothetical protein